MDVEVSEVDLKLCPLCGGKAEIIQYPANGKVTVSCGGCMANISFCPSKTEAIDRWNRRTDNA